MKTNDAPQNPAPLPPLSEAQTAALEAKVEPIAKQAPFFG
jgi:hypothetical protein